MFSAPNTVTPMISSLARAKTIIVSVIIAGKSTEPGQAHGWQIPFHDIFSSMYSDYVGSNKR